MGCSLGTYGKGCRDFMKEEPFSGEWMDDFLCAGRETKGGQKVKAKVVGT